MTLLKAPLISLLETLLDVFSCTPRQGQAPSLARTDEHTAQVLPSSGCPLVSSQPGVTEDV